MVDIVVGDRVRRVNDGKTGTVKRVKQGGDVWVDMDYGREDQGGPCAWERVSLDWGAPLEAYHPDGRVVRVGRARRGLRCWSITPIVEGYSDFRTDGTHYPNDKTCKWRIRNVVKPLNVGPGVVERDEPVDALQALDGSVVTAPAAPRDRWAFDEAQRIRTALGIGDVPVDLSPLIDVLEPLMGLVRDVARLGGRLDGEVSAVVERAAALVPLDPAAQREADVLARAREAVAEVCAAKGMVGTAREVRGGARDHHVAVQAVMRVLRESADRD